MTDSLASMFQRRERTVGHPLRPRPAAEARPAAEEIEETAAVPAPAEEPPIAQQRAATRPRPWGAAPAVAEPVGTKRNSIFLSDEQAHWIKTLRGRLMVAGQEISSSEVVRLALDRLRAAHLDDGAIYAAVLRSRPAVRPRGPRRTGEGRDPE